MDGRGKTASPGREMKKNSQAATLLQPLLAFHFEANTSGVQKSSIWSLEFRLDILLAYELLKCDCSWD